MTTESKTPIKELSVEARLIVTLLKDRDIGEQVTYEMIANQVGMKTIDGAYPPLQAAKRVLRREHNQVWDTIRTKGVRRLSDAETVEVTGERTRNRIRSTCRNSQRNLRTVNTDKLGERELTSFFMASAMANLMIHATKSKQVERIAEVAAGKKQELPMATVVKHLMED